MAGTVICDYINSANVSGGFFGVGQTWQNVTASRSAGVTYTNTTGKPMQVVISFVATSSIAISPSITIDSISNAVWSGADATSRRTAITFIVPNNSTYLVPTQTNVGLSSWLELR